MHIFPQETADGLDSLLMPTKASFAFDSAISPATDTSVLEKLLRSTASAQESEELFPIKTLLVSTGWNLNEDVFLQDETYLARHTPEDKPINYEHNELEIIGHMTSNACIDSEGNIMGDGLDLATLPESFNIMTDGVLYLHWQTEAKKKLLASIIATIEESKGRVSMECFFTGFDYAVIKNDKQYILARNQSTAFLTKFLKAYGGSGVYDGCRVGRALRNISFSGKGIVSNPANPKSIIITDTIPFKGIASVVDEVLGNSKQENILMSVELETKIAELNKAIASLQVKNDELTKTVADNENKAVKAEIEASKAAVAEKDAVITKITTEKTASESLVAEYKTKLEASEVALKAANDKIAQAAADQVKVGRIASLKAAGLDEAQATAKYEKFAALSDETFADVVALVKPTAPAAASTPSTPAAAPKAADVVDGAEKGKDAALASTTSGNEPTAAEKLQTDLAAFANKRLNNKTAITKK